MWLDELPWCETCNVVQWLVRWNTKCVNKLYLHEIARTREQAMYTALEYGSLMTEMACGHMRRSNSIIKRRTKKKDKYTCTQNTNEKELRKKKRKGWALKSDADADACAGAKEVNDVNYFPHEIVEMFFVAYFVDLFHVISFFPYRWTEELAD